MLNTRCPHCGTTFRVKPEQLRARNGRVRCGHCQAPFNALESLIDDPGLADTDSALTAQAQPEPEPPAAPEPPPAAEHSLAESDPPAAPPRAQDRKAQPAVASLEFNLDAPDLSDPEPAQPVAAADLDWDWQAEPQRREPAISDLAPPDEAANEPLIDEVVPLKDTEDAVSASTFTAYSSPAEETPELIEDAPPQAPDETLETDAQHLSDSEETEAPPQAWPWVLSIIVLVLLAGAQTLLWLRHDLARDFPDTRPYFVQACAQIGCAMPWPHVKARISIEASDLHPRAGHEGSFELAGTLRNRAKFTQAYPNLEITLTDEFNRALVRKVLPPRDWLPAALHDSRAFLASTDIAFTIYFEALDQPASGYKLYAFYP